MTTATSKHLDKTQPVFIANFCPQCGGSDGRLTTGTGPHYAKFSCADCGNFLRWVSKPKADDLIKTYQQVTGG